MFPRYSTCMGEIPPKWLSDKSSGGLLASAKIRACGSLISAITRSGMRTINSRTCCGISLAGYRRPKSECFSRHIPRHLVRRGFLSTRDRFESIVESVRYVPKGRRDLKSGPNFGHVPRAESTCTSRRRNTAPTNETIGTPRLRYRVLDALCSCAFAMIAATTFEARFLRGSSRHRPALGNMSSHSHRNQSARSEIFRSGLTAAHRFFEKPRDKHYVKNAWRNCST